MRPFLSCNVASESEGESTDTVSLAGALKDRWRARISSLDDCTVIPPWSVIRQLLMNGRPTLGSKSPQDSK